MWAQGDVSLTCVFKIWTECFEIEWEITVKDAGAVYFWLREEAFENVGKILCKLHCNVCFSDVWTECIENEWEMGDFLSVFLHWVRRWFEMDANSDIIDWEEKVTTIHYFILYGMVERFNGIEGISGRHVCSFIKGRERTEWERWTVSSFVFTKRRSCFHFGFMQTRDKRDRIMYIHRSKSHRSNVISIIVVVVVVVVAFTIGSSFQCLKWSFQLSSQAWNLIS